MTAGALLVGYGLSKFSGNMPRKYEIVRLMNRSSLTEVCKRAADLGFGSSNYIKNVKDCFDPFFENPRRGWDDDKNKARFSRYKEILEGYIDDYDKDQYANLLNYLLYNRNQEDKNNEYESIIKNI